jgi:hypothetical protein
VVIINLPKLKILKKLHLESLRLGCIKITHLLRNTSSKHTINFSAEQIVQILSRLHQGKACGIFGDSIDMYIKCARSVNLSTDIGKKRGKDLAYFFSQVASAQIPPKFQAILQKTYMVALEKDPGGDPNKLRPLGVPSDIQRIAVIAVLSEYSSVFRAAFATLEFCSWSRRRLRCSHQNHAVRCGQIHLGT